MNHEQILLTASRPSAPQSFDPVVVGKKAREHQDAERKAGREISTTAAVAHVLQSASPAKRTVGGPARTNVDYELEVRLQSELIRRDRAKHGY
jgi:hypothetical protein